MRATVDYTGMMWQTRKENWNGKQRADRSGPQGSLLVEAGAVWEGESLLRKHLRIQSVMILSSLRFFLSVF